MESNLPELQHQSFGIPMTIPASQQGSSDDAHAEVAAQILKLPYTCAMDRKNIVLICEASNLFCCIFGKQRNKISQPFGSYTDPAE
jgi:hypothetical protein